MPEQRGAHKKATWLMGDLGKMYTNWEGPQNSFQSPIAKHKRCACACALLCFAMGFYAFLVPRSTSFILLTQSQSVTSSACFFDIEIACETEAEGPPGGAAFATAVTATAVHALDTISLHNLYLRSL